MFLMLPGFYCKMKSALDRFEDDPLGNSLGADAPKDYCRIL